MQNTQRVDGSKRKAQGNHSNVHWKIDDAQIEKNDPTAEIVNTKNVTFSKKINNQNVAVKE